MYDTIWFHLKQENVQDIDLLSEVPVYLENKTFQENASGIKYTGSLSNLRITVNQGGVSVRGSLAKYYLSDNMQTLRMEDVEQAIEKLSDELHIPMKLADVTRLDFAENFIMKEKPEVYYPYLGESKYFKRSIFLNTLYYKNDSRQKVFYDKVKEAKKKSDIPPVWTDCNVLRIETRYHKRLAKKFKVPEVKAATLYNEKFYICLVDRFVDDYNSIHKNVEIDLDLNSMNSPKDFWEQVDLKYLDSLGFNGDVNLVEELRAKKVFKQPEYYSRIKRQIREKREKYKASDSNHLIQELDSKISVLSKHCR